MAKNSSEHPSPSSSPASNQKEGPRVLVVEDDGLNRHLLRIALEGQGYQCLEAENGLRGLEKLLMYRVDAVISDQQMPVMNGIDFIKEMQSRYGALAPPVILVSGGNESHLQRHAEELGVSACFRKPYHLETLLDSVAVITQHPSKR
jgi:two-component system, chemotaxis family, chemotaxis protein CheY